MTTKFNKFSKKNKIILSIIIAIIIIILGIIIYTDTENTKIREEYPKLYNAEIEINGSDFAVDTNLLYAIAFSKSSLDNQTIGENGERGIMQISQEQYEWVYNHMKEHKPRKWGDMPFERMSVAQFNVQYGSYLMSYYLDKYLDLNTALSAYDIGEEQVDKWLEDPSISQNNKLVFDKIPNEELKVFIKEVLDIKKMYEKAY
ncbi:MAG: transglycosylase SLT domain-containing protein [Oscillospiraceae bacterium]|nr:transglycosylase SLT domain-containing protein [Oscillospiraceae bacterium]